VGQPTNWPCLFEISCSKVAYRLRSTTLTLTHDSPRAAGAAPVLSTSRTVNISIISEDSWTPDDQENHEFLDYFHHPCTCTCKLQYKEQAWIFWVFGNCQFVTTHSHRANNSRPSLVAYIQFVPRAGSCIMHARVAAP